ncbi:MAG: PQQ-binding-like beta-propeller repeat protein, partial [Chloroflexia bacterium]|nr:PQQ-binding-like beta-propeller repeat protein [Chloroflexia bacterium]
MAKDANGNIWAGTPMGAYRFNGATWDSFNTATEVPGEVRSIAVDGNKVWFGTNGGGIHSYDVTNLAWAHETMANGNIPSNQVTAIAARNDSLFVGTPGNISFFNPAGGGTWTTEIIGAAGNEIYDIVMWDYGTVHASTADGLYYTGGSVWNPDGMLSSYKPTGVIERVNYELWIGFNENMKGVLPYMFSTPPPPYTVTGSQ